MRYPYHSRGSALLEPLIAMALIAIGFLGFYQIEVQALRFSQRAVWRQQAIWQLKNRALIQAKQLPVPMYWYEHLKQTLPNPTLKGKQTLCWGYRSAHCLSAR